jgi:hypothetical protein
MDASSVAVVVAVTEAVREALKVPVRYVPLIPVVLAQVVAVLTVYIQRFGQVSSFPAFFATSLWEGIKIASLAMSAYKIGKTTVLNRRGSCPAEAGADAVSIDLASN